MSRASWSSAFIAAAVLAASASSRADDRDRAGVQWGVSPIAKYTSDFGYTLGAFAQRFDYGNGHRAPFENLLSVETSYSTQGPSRLWVIWEQTHLTRHDLRLYAEVIGTYDPFNPYYGLGDLTPRIPELENQGFYEYRQRAWAVDALLRKQNDFLDADLQTGVLVEKVDAEPDQPASQFENDYGPEGRHDTYASWVLRVIQDKRDSEFIPSKGHFAAAGLLLSPGVLSTVPAWARLDLDYRYYFPLIPNRWLCLATQLRYTGTTQDTPLNEKARLGSLGTLRGLHLNRYLANDSASARVDLRSILIRFTIFGLPLKAGGGIFLDTGKVGDTLAELPGNRLHYAYGLSGIGSYFTDDFLGSADLGFSEGSSAIYIKLGHAF